MRFLLTHSFSLPRLFWMTAWLSRAYHLIPLNLVSTTDSMRDITFPSPATDRSIKQSTSPHRHLRNSSPNWPAGRLWTNNYPPLVPTNNFIHLPVHTSAYIPSRYQDYVATSSTKQPCCTLCTIQLNFCRIKWATEDNRHLLWLQMSHISSIYLIPCWNMIENLQPGKKSDRCINFNKVQGNSLQDYHVLFHPY